MQNDKQVAKYNNNINDIKLGVLTAKELDIFISLITSLQDAVADGELVIDTTISNLYPRKVYTFEEMRRILALSKDSYSNATMKAYLERMHKKLASIQCKAEYENGNYEFFTMFPRIKAHMETQTIEVLVDPSFLYIITETATHYTSFELDEYRSLSSVASKVMYQKLKQFKMTGKICFSDIGIFKEQMAFAKTARTNNVVTRVVKPAVAELKRIVPSLELTLFKEGKSHEVTGFELTFTPCKKKPDFLKKKEAESTCEDFLTGKTYRFPNNGDCRKEE